MQRGQQRRQLGNTRHAVVEVLQIMGGNNDRAAVVKLIFAVIQPQTECVGAELPYKFIGVLCAVQPQNLRPDTDAVQKCDGLFRRAPSGIIHVVSDDNFLRIARHDACLFCRDRGTKRCNSTRHACRMYGNDIHVALA